MTQHNSGRARKGRWVSASLDPPYATWRVRWCGSREAIANAGPIDQTPARSAAASNSISSGQLSPTPESERPEVDGLAEHRLGQQPTAVGSHCKPAGAQTVADQQIVHTGHRPELGAIIVGKGPESDANFMQCPGCESRRHGEPRVQYFGHACRRQAM